VRGPVSQRRGYLDLTKEEVRVSARIPGEKGQIVISGMDSVQVPGFWKIVGNRVQLKVRPIKVLNVDDRRPNPRSADYPLLKQFLGNPVYKKVSRKWTPKGKTAFVDKSRWVNLPYPGSPEEIQKKTLVNADHWLPSYEVSFAANPETAGWDEISDQTSWD
jgi:hypothetical protein